MNHDILSQCMILIYQQYCAQVTIMAFLQLFGSNNATNFFL